MPILLDEDDYISLTSEGVILQATNLRNVDWIYGIAVYTGKISHLILSAFQKVKSVSTSVFFQCNWGEVLFYCSYEALKFVFDVGLFLLIIGVITVFHVIQPATNFGK